MGKIKIILCDDSSSFIIGLEHFLQTYPQFEVIDKCSNGKELVNSRRLPNADLLLVDIEMPVLNGLVAARQVNFVYPALKMIAITTNIKTIYLQDIVYSGFKGFVYKPNLKDELIDSINKVIKNKFVFPKELNLGG